MVTFKGANLITVTFQTKPHWPPGHRELAFLRTFNFHATTGARSRVLSTVHTHANKDDHALSEILPRVDA